MIALISDTHLPRGNGRLPEKCLALLHEAELIVHAGDFIRGEILDALEAIGPVVAVHGNVDEPALQRRLPQTSTVGLANGAQLALIHNAGPREGRLARLRARFPHAAAAVFGHSHIPLLERDAADFQIFNPGSPTERRGQPHHTMGIAQLDPEGGISFELVTLD